VYGSGRQDSFIPDSDLHRGGERECRYFSCAKSKCPNHYLMFPREGTCTGSTGGDQYRVGLPCTSTCQPATTKNRAETGMYSAVRRDGLRKGPKLDASERDADVIARQQDRDPHVRAEAFTFSRPHPHRKKG
jgi:hypothetical protein